MDAEQQRRLRFRRARACPVTPPTRRGGRCAERGDGVRIRRRRACATYTQGSQSLDVTLYKMKDPTGAYGEYSYQRVPGMAARGTYRPFLDLARSRARAGGQSSCRYPGKNLTAHTADLKALVNAVAPACARRAAADAVAGFAAEERGRGHGSLRSRAANADQLFPGGLAIRSTFSKGAEAEVARYRVGGHDATLLIVDFPTPQMAEHMLADIKNEIQRGWIAAGIEFSAVIRGAVA